MSNWITKNDCVKKVSLVFQLYFCRNCLVGAAYHIKITDCAMFRPVYKNDYYRDPENNDQDVLPLRWIPWEVYVMVSRKKVSKI